MNQAPMVCPRCSCTYTRPVAGNMKYPTDFQVTFDCEGCGVLSTLHCYHMKGNFFMDWEHDPLAVVRFGRL